MTFSKILIANRGEIALRVMRTARRLGYGAVAVYSEADAEAPHVAAADEAVCIGPPAAADSYLSIERVLDAARSTAADAIHPGYGFLSENARFARACGERGVVFIGPPAAAIELMGNKRAAKAAMQAAGVPCVPGFSGDQSDAAMMAAAREIGLPVMVKAAAGGGGRGMRLCASLAELPEALRGARAEALAAFGDGELLLEKAIADARHVEVQIFADRHGHAVHLFERDCSVQRRHQKVIEECPSPAVDAALREKMGAAAVAAARACGYVGAGTVEFLLAADGNWYFLEMNTRLQVEHPVTELTTGLDLVEWQIRVARGQELPLAQADIGLSGHAIEARLYAEDPARGYLPQTGRILRWQPAAGVRVDAGIAPGALVSPHYDPMLAKIIAHGPSRDDARRKLVFALRETLLLGVISNKRFVAAVCEHEAFAAGRATTSFLAEEFAGDPSLSPEPPPTRAFALAALCAYLHEAQRWCEDDSLIGWRNASRVWSTIVLSAGGQRRELAITAGDGRRSRRNVVTIEDRTAASDLAFELASRGDGEWSLIRDQVRERVRYAIDGDRVWIDDKSGAYEFEDVTHRAAARERAGTGKLAAPLDGKIIDVRAKAGDRVDKGQLLLVIEAMKMQHRIAADVAGEVTALHVAAGDQVRMRQMLIEIAAEPVPA